MSTAVKSPSPPPARKAERAAVVGAKPGTSVELVPGKTFYPLADTDVPKFAIAELVPAGGGTFRVVARVAPREFAVSAANLRMLGIPFSRNTMHRLIRAGFIRSSSTSPNLHSFDYDSYLEHVAACRDPEFWDQEYVEPATRRKLTNRQRFSEAI